MAGVEGTGQDDGRKRDGRGSLTAERNGPGRRERAGWRGFPRNGRERTRTKGESGMAGVPSQWEGTGRDKRRMRNGRGSLTAGRNGPGAGTKGESGVAGVPSQREGTGQGEESGMSARSEAESEVGSGAGLEAE
jgi:hypothetical protein